MALLLTMKIRGMAQLAKEGISILLVTSSNPKVRRVCNYASWTRTCRLSAVYLIHVICKLLRQLVGLPSVHPKDSSLRVPTLREKKGYRYISLSYYKDKKDVSVTYFEDKKKFISTSCNCEKSYKEHIFKKINIPWQFSIVVLIIFWIALVKYFFYIVAVIYVKKEISNLQTKLVK